MSTTKSLKSRRRWFQFSLRSLLIVVTVFAIWLGLQVNRANRQRRAVEAIGAMGGNFYYDYQRRRVPTYPGSTGRFAYTTDATLPGPAWLRERLGDEYFVTPVWLFAGKRVVDRGGLAYLKDLPQIEELWLADVVLSAKDLDHLEHLSKLKTLLLVSVSADKTPPNQQLLHHVRHLERLLLVDPTPRISNLLDLRSAESLREFSASRTEVDDDDLARMSRLNKLERLQLSGTALTDKGLAHLSALPRLVHLSLNATAVTDAGLEHLARIRSLRQLELTGTKVTAAGVEKLRAALPNCKITY